MTHDDVLTFWFEVIDPRQWWAVDPAFDQRVGTQFGNTLQQAVAGELSVWRASPPGRLAEVIVIDQFSRNIHRGKPAAFAFDAVALVLAQEAVAAHADQALPPAQRNFLYMPYMHSESRTIHTQAERLFTANEQPDSLNFELRHKAIVDRFGRYPHRNAVLGRASTDEEIEFLKQPGSSF